MSTTFPVRPPHTEGVPGTPIAIGPWTVEEKGEGNFSFEPYPDGGYAVLAIIGFFLESVPLTTGASFSVGWDVLIDEQLIAQWAKQIELQEEVGVQTYTYREAITVILPPAKKLKVRSNGVSEYEDKQVTLSYMLPA